MKYRTTTVMPEVNFDLLYTITKNNHVFTRQLLQAFLIELTGLKDQLKPVLDPADLLLLSRSYHTIHPSFKMLGLEVLADQLDHFRRPGAVMRNSGDIDRSDEYLKLSASIFKVIEQVEAFLLRE